MLRRFLLCRYRNLFLRSAQPVSVLIQEHRRQKLTYRRLDRDAVQAAECSNDKKRTDVLLSLLAHLEKPPRSCIEIGCESGWLGTLLKARYADLTYAGIDIQFEELPGGGGDARTNVQAQAEYIPFKNGTFDFAVAMHVLEHIRDTRQFRTEITRVLTPGSPVLIALPLGFDDEPCHFWHYMSEQGWRRFLFKRYGLQFVGGRVVHGRYHEFVGVFRIPSFRSTNKTPP